jgi:uncharacterized protein (TIGR03437 family)
MKVPIIAIAVIQAMNAWSQAPNVSSIANAAGIPQNVLCNPGCGSAVISPNTWMSVYGTDLSPVTRSWESSDFTNGKMPTNLSGVTVNLLGDYGPNGSAYISYISPTQINILTPANLSPESTGYGIQVGVPSGATNCSSSESCPFIEYQDGEPEFFLYGGTPYVIAEHADGTLIGPPGVSGATSAKPGETIVLYANDLGPTSGSISNGSDEQSGVLLTTPTVMVASHDAAVQFAGLISPGLYQVNVKLPNNISGDVPVSITITASIGTLSFPVTSLPTTLLPVN